MKHPSTLLNDARVEAVLARLHQQAQRQTWRLVLHYLPQLSRLILGRGVRWDAHKAAFMDDKFIAISPDQGKLLYLLARSLNAQTIVEFGTSFGVSTIYLACAVRDNGGGVVVGTEMVPAKAAQARQHLAEAGLSEFVELREGNALETLRDFGSPIDLLLNDGFPTYQLDVLKLLHPHIRRGGIVVTDNAGLFKEEMKSYLEFLRDPTNGYCATTLALNDGTELAVRVAAAT
jgi:predicted O-methyltransferase YrrM